MRTTLLAVILLGVLPLTAQGQSAQDLQSDHLTSDQVLTYGMGFLGQCVSSQCRCPTTVTTAEARSKKEGNTMATTTYDLITVGGGLGGGCHGISLLFASCRMYPAASKSISVT